MNLAKTNWKRVASQLRPGPVPTEHGEATPWGGSYPELLSAPVGTIPLASQTTSTLGCRKPRPRFTGSPQATAPLFPYTRGTRAACPVLSAEPSPGGPERHQCAPGSSQVPALPVVNMPPCFPLLSLSVPRVPWVHMWLSYLGGSRMGSGPGWWLVAVAQCQSCHCCLVWCPPAGVPGILPLAKWPGILHCLQEGSGPCPAWQM